MFKGIFVLLSISKMHLIERSSSYEYRRLNCRPSHMSYPLAQTSQAAALSTRQTAPRRHPAKRLLPDVPEPLIGREVRARQLRSL